MLTLSLARVLFCYCPRLISHIISFVLLFHVHIYIQQFSSLLLCAFCYLTPSYLVSNFSLSLLFLSHVGSCQLLCPHFFFHVLSCQSLCRVYKILILLLPELWVVRFLFSFPQSLYYLAWLALLSGHSVHKSQALYYAHWFLRSITSLLG